MQAFYSYMHKMSDWCDEKVARVYVFLTSGFFHTKAYTCISCYVAKSIAKIWTGNGWLSMKNLRCVYVSLIYVHAYSMYTDTCRVFWLIFLILLLTALPYSEFEKNENTVLVTTARGGHFGFMEGIFPFGETWMNRAIRQSLSVLKSISTSERNHK